MQVAINAIACARFSRGKYQSENNQETQTDVLGRGCVLPLGEHVLMGHRCVRGEADHRHPWILEIVHPNISEPVLLHEYASDMRTMQFLPARVSRMTCSLGWAVGEFVEVSCRTL